MLRYLMSAVLVLALAACKGTRASARGELPTPFGPAKLELTIDGQVVRLSNTLTTREIHGTKYEVYRDNHGEEWLRSTKPPHDIVRADHLRPPNAGTGDNGLYRMNARATSRRLLWDFRRATAATALAATGLDRLSNQRGVRQSARGATVVEYDNLTYATHVVYPMRTDFGLPDLSLHPGVRYDIQLLDNFMSIAVEGDLRDVARFLAAQGIQSLRPVRVTHGDLTFEVDVTINAQARVVMFSYGTQVLQVIPF